jgi:predicted CopG family antitoxin
MSVTLTITLQSEIYEELKSVAAEKDNATFSEIIGNLLLIRKFLYGRKEKDTMQVEFWRGNEVLFSIFKFNDERKKPVGVQQFSRMEPRWAKIYRMTPQGFHAFMRTHNLVFAGKFDF